MQGKRHETAWRRARQLQARFDFEAKPGVVGRLAQQHTTCRLHGMQSGQRLLHQA